MHCRRVRIERVFYIYWTRAVCLLRSGLKGFREEHVMHGKQLFVMTFIDHLHNSDCSARDTIEQAILCVN